MSCETEILQELVCSGIYKYLTKRGPSRIWRRPLDVFLIQAGPLTNRHITQIKAIARIVLQASRCII